MRVRLPDPELLAGCSATAQRAVPEALNQELQKYQRRVNDLHSSIRSRNLSPPEPPSLSEASKQGRNDDDPSQHEVPKGHITTAQIKKAGSKGGAAAPSSAEGMPALTAC